jgi:hypothetical protein
VGLACPRAWRSASTRERASNSRAVSMPPIMLSPPRTGCAAPLASPIAASARRTVLAWAPRSWR